MSSVSSCCDVGAGATGTVLLMVIIGAGAALAVRQKSIATGFIWPVRHTSSAFGDAKQVRWFIGTWSLVALMTQRWLAFAAVPVAVVALLALQGLERASDGGWRGRLERLRLRSPTRWAALTAFGPWLPVLTFAPWTEGGDE